MKIIVDPPEGYFQSVEVNENNDVLISFMPIVPDKPEMTSDEDEFPDEVEQAHAEQSEKKPVGGTLEDGYYYTEIFDREHEENGFVEVWKVVTSQTSGKPYAKKLDMASGQFEYAPGAMKHLVSEATPLSLEIAKKYGALYGRCMICGRTLTDEGSIEAGIGPICAGRL